MIPLSVEESGPLVRITAHCEEAADDWLALDGVYARLLGEPDRPVAVVEVAGPRVVLAGWA